MSERLRVDVAVAKAKKYASSESGDTVEIVERPNGGLSVVVADGQRSGQSAKAISNMVVRKAISLLAEGVRDGAVARATHDYLRTQRGAQVSAELSIISVDLVTRTLVISRNASCPSLMRHGAEFIWLDVPSEAVGIRRNTKPAISEFALVPAMTLVVFTDGVWSAGATIGSVIDLPGLLTTIDPDHSAPARTVADVVLERALALEHGRPRDDATVLVLKLITRTDEGAIRRMTVEFPI
ncbi:MAG: serine/threonine-protein phosphatase [Caldilineaceae bacterium]|nr:serine/threonine-protein phosphatase [Caldilineaceae bacterium]